MSLTDFLLIFAAAFGAGLIIVNESLGVIGFVIAHASASAFFVGVLTIPGLLGLADFALTNAILTQAVVIVFRAQFPFALLSSFLGCVLGRFLGEKLDLFE